MITEQTTLSGLVAELRASDRTLRRNLKELVKAVNQAEVQTDTAEVTTPRRGAAKERRFAAIAAKYIDLAELREFPDEEAREDAMDVAITRALNNVGDGSAPDESDPVAVLRHEVKVLKKTVAILKDLHRMNTLRAQYERHGGSVSDPDFGLPTKVTADVQYGRWIDAHREGKRVTRAQVAEALK